MGQEEKESQPRTEGPERGIFRPQANRGSTRCGKAVVKAYDLSVVQGWANGNEVPFARKRAWGRWRSAVVADPWYKKAGEARWILWLQTMQ